MMTDAFFLLQIPTRCRTTHSYPESQSVLDAVQLLGRLGTAY